MRNNKKTTTFYRRSLYLVEKTDRQNERKIEREKEEKTKEENENQREKRKIANQIDRQKIDK